MCFDRCHFVLVLVLVFVFYLLNCQIALLKQVETTAPLLLETCTACCSPGSLGPMTDHLDEILFVCMSRP